MYPPSPSARTLQHGNEDLNAWILNNDTRILLQPPFDHTQAAVCCPDASIGVSGRTSREQSLIRPWSSCSSMSSGDRCKVVTQLEGLFQIPERHLLPGMNEESHLRAAIDMTGSDSFDTASSQTSFTCDSGEEPHGDTEAWAHPLGLASTAVHGRSFSRYTFDSIAKSACSTNTTALPSCRRWIPPKSDQIPPLVLDFSQQLSPSVTAIRFVWASLEANRGTDKHRIDLHLISRLSTLISPDGHTLFEYHVSHLLSGTNNTVRLQKLWQSLSAGQKTYWRKHSAKFQLPLAFEYWQLALRNLETDDHSERYSSLVRKAKKVLEDSSVDAEGHLIASPNWRNPAIERELQLWKLDTFAATRKIQRRLHELRVGFGPRRPALCRNLARFVAGTGWTMFAYHGLPRIEEMGEKEAMAKLRAVWSGMTADDRIYWIQVTARIIPRLRDGRVDVLAFFSFDAWAVKEARECAEAWRRLL